MRVNADISDLFFNTDLSPRTRRYDHRGDFIGFDLDALTEEATTFLSSLERLGVAVPTAEDLVADFLNRV